jgi:hypothetical protein
MNKHAVIQYLKRNSLKVSNDEIAVVGKNGYLFLYKGFNRYFQMYHDNPSTVEEVIEKWKVSVDSWTESVTSKSANFYFVLVPNKASLLQEYYPFALPKGGTPYLSRLTKTTSVQVFSPRKSENIFRQNDTHLSPKGNFEFAMFIVKTLGIDFDFGDLVLKGSEEIVGDLGSKFDPPISEKVQYFANSIVASIPKLEYDNSSEYLPERHIGISISFTNSIAPTKKSLKIFGNSFLGTAGEYSSLWLLALVFERVTFYWSPVLITEHLEKEDIVIFQTCERFLGYSPDHWH